MIALTRVALESIAKVIAGTDAEIPTHVSGLVLERYEDAYKRFAPYTRVTLISGKGNRIFDIADDGESTPVIGPSTQLVVNGKVVRAPSWVR